jgi:hypothetical protein
VQKSMDEIEARMESGLRKPLDRKDKKKSMADKIDLNNKVLEELKDVKEMITNVKYDV